MIPLTINCQAGAAGSHADQETIGRVPRVARLLALAIRLDQLIASDVVTDYAELARLGHVSRARISQIMSLLQLAPDLQEQILFWPLTHRGRDSLSLSDLLPVVRILSWQHQRRSWQARRHAKSRARGDSKSGTR